LFQFRYGVLVEVRNRCAIGRLCKRCVIMTVVDCFALFRIASDCLNIVSWLIISYLVALFVVD